MKTIIFSTGNDGKYTDSLLVCKLYEIDVIQRNIDVVEIQSEDPEKVAIDKAAKAYEILRKPLVVSDDSWAIPGLKGFPGVYMHSINEWFTPDDFLRLTQSLDDRRAILTQHLVYIDGVTTKLFKANLEGKLLTEIRGKSKHPSHTVIAMNGDNGLSIAEVHENELNRTNRDPALIWHNFAKWYSDK
jgi:XTP/dITP diphosphohydrolase